MNLEVRQLSTCARGGHSISPVHTRLVTETEVTLRESQLQCIRELHEAERLQQMRGRPQDMNHVLGCLVDAGADDRKTRFVALQMQDRIERLPIGRLDQDDVRVGGGSAVEELRLVPQPSDDRRIEAPDVFVRFDDQEKSHDHVLVDRRMFSRAGQV
jgi:hypothetical protein